MGRTDDTAAWIQAEAQAIADKEKALTDKATQVAQEILLLSPMDDTDEEHLEALVRTALFICRRVFHERRRLKIAAEGPKGNGTPQ